ncbi:MAG TPA: class I SAM-dependent methyltransferase [Myxococcota bacterium]|nr:class I SAM-dependent methyltransferase [Myxococcota bacterium]
MLTYEYDGKFFNYIEAGSKRSAAVVASLMLEALPIRSVLDVGCGRGAWMAEWMRRDVQEVDGVDGFYVDANHLEVPRERFHARDISQPFRLSRSYDLVTCLEVAEHIDTGAADTLIDNLTSHGQLVLFSAAPPGQGGEYHVNERPYGYWRDKFASRGFHLFDFLRPRLLHQRNVEPWYRYNTLLFAHEDRTKYLPPEILATAITPSAPVVDLAPLTWRIRKQMLRLVPRASQIKLAKIKHALVRVVRRTA